MDFVCDLHLHSKYSRAVSPSMTLPFMALWAEKKGIDVLSATDFTHPLWFREIKTLLEEDAPGVYKLKKSANKTRFMLSTEIASIFKQDDKLRRIHNLLFAPNLEVAEKINQELTKRGCNISSDGRPIVGLSSKQLLEMALSIDKQVILIPCHVWTPHFGLYGSASGFDSIEQSFGELSKYIYGIETGISSDPFMNWQIPELEKRSILSFSDAHSAPKMGRESTVFTLPKLSYLEFGRAVARPNETTKISHTIEFYPEEGKYHFTGHRNCGISLSPKQVKEKGAICPVCKKRLTEGVMFRVQQVAGFAISTSEPNLQPDENGVGWIRDPKNIHPPFVKLVPLLEIIAESLNSTVTSEKSKILFDKMCQELGNEIEILLKTSDDEIKRVGGEKVLEGVSKVRRGNIAIEPGFDGEYGKVAIWSDKISDKKKIDEAPKEQIGLF